MFGSLGSEIRAVATVDIDALSADEHMAAVVELARCRAQLDAAEARVLAAWDAKRAWVETGAKSAAAALTHVTRQSKAECTARLRAARAMRTLPLTGDAWLAGDVTREHVRLLARARNERTTELLVRDEAMLVQQASTLSFSAFAKVMAYWLQHADPDGTSEKELERNDRRHVSVVQTPSGEWLLSGLLDAVAGESVASELARIEQELFDDDRTEAK